jgi:hypothetical protein
MLGTSVLFFRPVSFGKRAIVIDWMQAAGVPTACAISLDETVVSDVADERRTFAASDGVPHVRSPRPVEGQAIPWLSPALS